MIVLLVLAFIAVCWVWPTAKAAQIGERKGMSNAWLWGFALGWVGVIILASAQTPKRFAITPAVGYSSAPYLSGLPETPAAADLPL